MCRKINKKGCEHPERLKRKPEECTPKQIKKCHGDIPTEEHPCISENEKR